MKASKSFGFGAFSFMTRPNILLILTDQQRCDTLSCYGSSFTSTPNLDRLASEGILFTRAYCAAPLCTPSRASIFTGQYQSRHGVWHTGVNFPENIRLASHLFNEAGYVTGYVGKAHFQAFGDRDSLECTEGADFRCPSPYYGFQEAELASGHGAGGLNGHYGAWVCSQVSAEDFARFRQDGEPLSKEWFGGDAYDWDIPLRLHNSVWTADRSVAFLERRQKRKPGQPWFLCASFQDPHHNHGVPPEFNDRVDPAQVPDPDYVEGELDDKPPHFKEARQGKLDESAMRGQHSVFGQGYSVGYERASREDMRLGRAYYHTLVKLIDREVGRILAALEKSGQAKDTVVVFTTDHGELLGDHGLWMKGPFLYEPLVKVPLLMRWPAGLPSGQRQSGLFSQADLLPTLCAACGIPDSIGNGGFDGHDALPWLRGQAGLIRDHAFVEAIDDPDKLRLKTVVTPDRKLTFYYGDYGKKYGELYDLEKDPREKKNLWNEPAYASDKARLIDLILKDTPTLQPRLPRISYA
jgi:arylsulfatase A-like enzyme